MEYKILIMEKLLSGKMYSHIYPIDPFNLEEAERFRAMHFHSDCIFLLEYSLN